MVDREAKRAEGKGVGYDRWAAKHNLKQMAEMCIRDSPYTAQMIATITCQQIGTVERALQIVLKLGLVEVLDSGTFYMLSLIHICNLLK